MSAGATSSLLEALRRLRLLTPGQLDEVAKLQDEFPEPRALACELVRRGWLTAFQAGVLLQGKGQRLFVDSYVLLERIGEGGMAVVYKARHRGLGRIAAVKLIRKDRLGTATAVRRFLREVRAVAALSHPNIVVAYDAGEVNGAYFLAMEYVEGAIDLARLVERDVPLPVARACAYVRQAALGLQHAHERGLVHRDVKPHNLLITADGRTVKILDMGLARLDLPGHDESGSVTREGYLVGTPNYIAPEQAVGSHTVDIRADLYSLGCTLYDLLTGAPPFPEGTLLEKLDKHRFVEPTDVEVLRPEVPRAVGSVVRKLMAKDPRERYQTPAELAAALASVLVPGPDPSLADGAGDVYPCAPESLRPVEPGDVSVKRLDDWPRSASGDLLRVDCPGCGRHIMLRDSELLLLIECAGCDTRFYPVTPLEGTLSSPESPSATEAVGRPYAAPRARPRRRKRRDWLPLVVGVAVSAVVFFGFGIGFLILLKSGAFDSRPAARRAPVPQGVPAAPAAPAPHAAPAEPPPE